MTALFPCPLAEWDSWYLPQEQDCLKTEEENFLPNGWWKFANGRIVIPQSLVPTFVKQFHEETHSGRIALETLAQYLYVPKLSSISKTVCERCNLCAQNNPRQGPRLPTQVQSIGRTPLENLVVGFTVMP
jgi:hypothetical protein